MDLVLGACRDEDWALDLGLTIGIEIESPKGEKNVSRITEHHSSDRTTLVDYSVMFYYTPQVQANVPDLDGFFEQLIAVTNQGR